MQCIKCHEISTNFICLSTFEIAYWIIFLGPNLLFYFLFRIEKVEYEAFCAWTLLKTDGLLFPSDLSIGLIRNKNQYYAFSSVEAAELFMQNPDA